jgi:prevent-host-death family protein
MPMRTVSLMTANQEFSKLIKKVEQGEGFLITRRGRPVAKLVPHFADKAEDPAWSAAYRRMMARLRKGAPLGGLRVERVDLYDR